MITADTYVRARIDTVTKDRANEALTRRIQGPLSLAIHRQRGWALAVVVLVIASTVALARLPAPEIMSIQRKPLNVFVQPGVVVWWLLLAGPYQFAPRTLAGSAVVVAANTACYSLGIWLAVALVRGSVTRLWYFIAAPVLTVASAAIVFMRESSHMIPSIVRDPLVHFVDPGVAVWWFLFGNIFQSSPYSRGGMAFAALANAGFWLFAFWLLVVFLGFLRQRFHLRP